MPTTNHRIAAYLPPDINHRFQTFKQERGMGDSQALITILSEFLGTSPQQEVLISHTSGLPLIEMVERLSNDINDINPITIKSELKSELLSELKSELLSELLSGINSQVLALRSEIEASRSELLSELDSRLLNKIVAQDTIPSEDPSNDLPDNALDASQSNSSSELNSDSLSMPYSEEITPIILNISDLAKRLGCSRPTVDKKRKENLLPEWSKDRDPSGYTWVYDTDLKKYRSDSTYISTQPVSNLDA